MQRALLGNITANIRAITFELKCKKISLFFYFEGEPDTEDKELVSVVETEVIADFDEDFTVEAVAVRLDYPQPIKNTNGLLVFLKRD